MYLDRPTLTGSASGRSSSTSSQPHNLTEDEAAELGSKVAALVGLDIEGEESPEIGGEEGEGVFSEEEGRRGTSSARSRATWPPLLLLLLLEHHWAVGLRDAIGRANGFRIADAFISPLDLVAVGVTEAEEAERHQAVAKPATATPGSR